MKHFEKDKFMKELDDLLKTFVCIDTNMAYDNLVETIIKVLDKYAPIKKKKLRGNNSRFMNKNLSKAIMKRSALKSKYLKNQIKSNRDNYKRQRNLCVKLKNMAIKSDFKSATINSKFNSKPFYDLIKPYMTNKGALCSTDINIMENGNLITDEREIVEIFNEYYINIIKHTSGQDVINIEDTFERSSQSDDVIDKIVETYKKHPSINCIKTKISNIKSFKFQPTNESEVLETLKLINPKKAIGIDLLSPKLIKESAEILTKPLTDIINKSIIENTFPTKAKIAAIIPFFKKDDRSQKKNYRPVSVLSTFSKVIERILKNQIVNYIENFLSPYVSAYRKNYSSHHVLIRLLEEWKTGLDNGNFVGAVLMDLSKAFDCIPHDLLIAKLEAYGFQRTALKYMYSYLKGRRQSVKINGVFSKFLTILAGVPQGSILGPILFNIFINDLYFFFSDANIHGFADDHTISAISKSLETLKSILCKDSNIALDWLNENKMLANPSKFQAIILTKSKDRLMTSLKIKDKVIESKELVELLGVTIDDQLKFDEHISKLCRKAGGQLNTLYRFKHLLGSFSKQLAVNSFIYSNFHYCQLVWNFSSANSLNKIENIQKRALLFLKDCANHDLPNQCKKPTMKIKRLRTLATEIFKTLNNLNPTYMKNIFYRSENRTSERLKFNIQAQKYSQVKYGKNSLRVLGPILWNSLPQNVKSLKSLPQFKKFMKSWGQEGCPHYQKFFSYYLAIK